MVKSHSSPNRLCTISSIAIAVVSLFPIRTLLKEADQIFLLPFERHMKNYIKASLFYSYISRISLPFILLIVFFPLFYKLSHNDYGFYIAFSISTLLYPYLVLLIKWQWVKLNKNVFIINLLLFIPLAVTHYIILKFHNYLAF